MMTVVLGIDPGPEKSAVVMWDGAKVLRKDYYDNQEICLGLTNYLNYGMMDVVVIEMPKSHGMPVGKDVFETCRWVGIFQGTCESYCFFETYLVYRNDVQLHFCQTTRAKKSNVNRVLKDRFGEKGTKDAPGILYGIDKDGGHMWDALAVAVYWYDTHNK